MGLRQTVNASLMYHRVCVLKAAIYLSTHLVAIGGKESHLIGEREAAVWSQCETHFVFSIIKLGENGIDYKK